MTLRLATPSDAQSISSLLFDAFSPFASLYTPGGLNATVLTPAAVTKRMTEGRTWVALEDDICVGTISCKSTSTGLYLCGMAVDPSHQGKQIGLGLLRAIEKHAIDNGHKRMYLSTTPFLLKAIRLYEKFGFVKIDDPPHELDGTKLFTMERLL